MQGISLCLASWNFKFQILQTISVFGRRGLAIEFTQTLKLLGRNKSKKT